MVKIERIVPDVTVADLALAVREHTAVLGLDVVMDHGWIVTLADATGHQLSLITQDATAPVDPSVSIFVDDVTTAYETAKASGVEISTHSQPRTGASPASSTAAPPAT